MIKVAMHNLYKDRVGGKIGFLYLYDSDLGLVIESRGLPINGDGYHGMHIHEFGNLGSSRKPDGEIVPGGKAGEHYDPEHTGIHAGPMGNGHRGDLPKILVRDNSWAGIVTAPRLTLDEVKNRSIIIHAGGDNYSDYPMANGCGMGRIIGGVITNGCPYCESDNTISELIGLSIMGFALNRWFTK